MDLLTLRPGGHRLRPICQLAPGLLLLAMCGCSPMATTNDSDGSTHLFAWAWDVDKGADDFLAVIDVDRLSATYGQVISTLPAQGGRGAHHVEYELATGQVFANAFETGRTFVFDLGDPAHPQLLSDFGDAGPFAHPHSFARTPSGTVLGTFQGRADDHGAVGGLVELDDRGRMLRGSRAADPQPPFGPVASPCACSGRASTTPLPKARPRLHVCLRLPRPHRSPIGIDAATSPSAACAQISRVVAYAQVVMQLVW